MAASSRMPVLFLHGEYDYTCETVDSRLADPMRRDCRNLTEVVVPSGHWMAQEKPVAVNAALAKWLAVQFPELWARLDRFPATSIYRSPTEEADRRQLVAP